MVNIVENDKVRVTEVMNLKIETYSGKFDDEIISLILSIQNEEAKIGLALYNELLKYAVSKEVHSIILDTPAVAHASHRFYEKAGFRRISTAELPVPYSYPDRDSILYLLKL